MSQELCVRNRQRVRPVDLRLFRKIVRNLMEEKFCGRNSCICIHLVDSVEITRLNEGYLRHGGPTDVITFFYSKDELGGGLTKTGAPRALQREAVSPERASLQGEIFISVPEAIEQAQEFRTTWPAELVRYAVHGLLHLLGYDDQTARERRVMKREEDRMVRGLSRRFDLQGLARRRRGA